MSKKNDKLTCPRIRRRIRILGHVSYMGYLKISKRGSGRISCEAKNIRAKAGSGFETWQGKAQLSPDKNSVSNGCLRN